jgi:hypothetical protein
MRKGSRVVGDGCGLGVEISEAGRKVKRKTYPQKPEGGHPTHRSYGLHRGQPPAEMDGCFNI